MFSRCYEVSKKFAGKVWRVVKRCFVPTAVTGGNVLTSVGGAIQSNESLLDMSEQITGIKTPPSSTFRLGFQIGTIIPTIWMTCLRGASNFRFFGTPDSDFDLEKEPAGEAQNTLTDEDNEVNENAGRCSNWTRPGYSKLNNALFIFVQCSAYASLFFAFGNTLNSAAKLYTWLVHFLPDGEIGSYATNMAVGVTFTLLISSTNIIKNFARGTVDSVNNSIHMIKSANIATIKKHAGILSATIGLGGIFLYNTILNSYFSTSKAVGNFYTMISVSANQTSDTIANVYVTSSLLNTIPNFITSQQPRSLFNLIEKIVNKIRNLNTKKEVAVVEKKVILPRTWIYVRNISYAMAIAESLTTALYIINNSHFTFGDRAEKLDIRVLTYTTASIVALTNFATAINNIDEIGTDIINRLIKAARTEELNLVKVEEIDDTDYVKMDEEQKPKQEEKRKLSSSPQTTLFKPKKVRSPVIVDSTSSSSNDLDFGDKNAASLANKSKTPYKKMESDSETDSKSFSI